MHYFLYYLVILIVGITCATISIDNLSTIGRKISIIRLALLGAAGMAANGGAIFYIRKLYKLCFTENLKLDIAQNSFIKKVGTIIYFAGRPIFSISFSVLIVLGFRSGTFIMTNNSVELSEGFVYTVMFVSFFVGFQSGNFIKKLENYGNGIIEQIYKEKKI